MKKINVIISIIFITIVLIIGGFCLGKTLARKNTVNVSKDEVNNIETNKSYNITKTNAISQYIPKDITEVNLINYMF